MSIMCTLKSMKNTSTYTLFLPEDHILRPDHRLGNLMGG